MVRSDFTGMPSLVGRRLPIQKELLLVVDTSGSMSDIALARVVPLLDELFRTFSKVHLVQIDTELVGQYLLKKNQPLPPFKGGGGTNFLPPLNRFLHDKPFVENLVIYTDGAVTDGKKVAEAFPNILWLLTPAPEGRREPWMGDSYLFLPQATEG